MTTTGSPLRTRSTRRARVTIPGRGRRNVQLGDRRREGMHSARRSGALACADALPPCCVPPGLTGTQATPARPAANRFRTASRTARSVARKQSELGEQLDLVPVVTHCADQIAFEIRDRHAPQRHATAGRPDDRAPVAERAARSGLPSQPTPRTRDLRTTTTAPVSTSISENASSWSSISTASSTRDETATVGDQATTSVGEQLVHRGRVTGDGRLDRPQHARRVRSFAVAVTVRLLRTHVRRVPPGRRSPGCR